MATKYNTPVTTSKTRFTAAPMSELEFSTLDDTPALDTTLDAGYIVPVYCAEVLPHDTFDVSLDFVTRQATMAVPVMGKLVQDFYAFFVPNRIVNKSFKMVMGENTSGAWAAEDVELAPLLDSNTTSAVQIPIGSLADYYGFPTQMPIPAVTLQQCHDLKFRGYLEIYNNFFRSESYQPPIPYSKLNVYNGFLLDPDQVIGVATTVATTITNGTTASGQFGASAVVEAVAGQGGVSRSAWSGITRKTAFSAKAKPLKANKMLDYFTSCLPSPQKGRQVAVPVYGQVPLNTTTEVTGVYDNAVKVGNSSGNSLTGLLTSLNNYVCVSDGSYDTMLGGVQASNLVADLDNASVSITVNDLRMSSAMQRVYETLGRGGSRYTEFVNSFFGIEVDNPFDDIPTLLGHFRRELDMFQTAQTSATPPANTPGTPQGNLAAFGYTNKDGKLFTKTFNEHGYIHIVSVIRHRNSYGSTLSRDNFRRGMLDFYSYPLANIGEQPVYLREINPFGDPNGVFGFQEAWAEYRYEPDRVTAYMRDMPPNMQSLSAWNYSDNFDDSIDVNNGDFMLSNTDEVVTRSTALTDREYPQFKLHVDFRIRKERPLPVYSVPGADIF